MKKSKEMRSLNAKLPTLYLEELEQRLETDPLTIGGLLSVNLDIAGCDVFCKTDCEIYCPSDCSDDCGVFCETKCGEYTK